MQECHYGLEAAFEDTGPGAISPPRDERCKLEMLTWPGTPSTWGRRPHQCTGTHNHSHILHKHTPTRTHTHALADIHAHGHVLIHMHPCMHAHTHTHSPTHMHTNMFSYACTRVYTGTHVHAQAPGFPALSPPPLALHPACASKSLGGFCKP